MNAVEKTKRKLNLYRRRKHWSDLNCIFIHVPKAAGTSISVSLYGKPLGHYTAQEINNHFPFLYRSCFTFSIVRNPWDRLLSAYRFAKVGRTDVMGVHNPAQYKVNEFSSFERFLFDWLVPRKVESLDFIFQPQFRFVCDKDFSPMVDYLGRFESIKKDIAKVSNAIGRDLVLGRSNSTVEDSASYRQYYINDDMVNIVKQIYADDIRIFGYSF